MKNAHFLFTLLGCAVSTRKARNIQAVMNFNERVFAAKNLAASMVYVIHSNDSEAYFHARWRTPRKTLQKH